MCTTFRTISLMFILFELSSVFLTNAFETYSETDQLAEESVGGYDKEGPHESTTNTNLISAIKEPLIANEESVKDKDISVEDDQFDPLQKILPKVKFNCKGKSEGYYADNEFCEVFHYCKTNGFRFTFMCPPESYYNDKLMACEFNSTLSKCVENRNNYTNEIQNKTSQTVKQTSIKPSAGQTLEVLDKSSSQINSNTEKSITVSTTTTELTKNFADPYLTRRRTPYGGSRPKSNSDKTKDQNNTQYILPEKRSQNQTTLSENKVNVTQTILPFNGFRKSNRNKILKNHKNNSQSIDNSFKSTENVSQPKEPSLRIPLNALPVLKSLRPNHLSNLNQERLTETLKTYRNKSPIKAGTTSTTTTTTLGTTTTTPHPSLLGPTAYDSTTSSPFDYFTPIFNSGSNFNPLNSDFYPLSMHKRPENSDKSNKRKSFMTQSFYNSIAHTTGRPHIEPNIEKESQIEETLKQSETNSQFSPFNQMKGSTHSSRNKANRAPLFDNDDQDQMSDDSHLSESQIHELIEKLKKMDSNERLNPDLQESDISVGTSVEPNETIEGIDESAETGRGDRKTKPKFLKVPLLVPTGISRRDLRRKLSTTLLKPTVLPLTETGEEMPAYVLQFPKTERSGKAKHNKQRSKRQIFNWNPFQSNPFSSNSYYLPMNSMRSPVYSNFQNNVQNTHPMNTYSSRHWNLGEQHNHAFGLPASAQQHIPYYIPPKQPFIPNNFINNDFYRDNNIYDLSEFSDFYENPRHLPLEAQDMSPYRSVSLKRPGFKRPPRRQKIPETNKLNSSQTSNDTKTTVRPHYSVPVSPRPYSQQIQEPIVNQQFYSRTASNPFTDFSDDSLSEAIKVFDSSDDNLQPLDPDFDSQPLFPFNSGRSFSNDFIPITPKTPTFAETLNGRSSRLNTFSEIPINYGTNSYIADDFPPLPNFGDPTYRLPFIDIPDPSHSNSGNRHNLEKSSSKESVQRKNDNNSRYSTPYSPEMPFNTNPENQTERNPNHNYDNVDKTDLQSDKTVDIKQKSVPIFTPKLNYNWENIVGQYHKRNLSLSNIKANVNKNDSKDQKESEISPNQRYISYGTRLSGNTNRYSQNPEVSVKTSVSSISSLEPEASNQVIISRKFGTSSDLSSQPSQPVNDNKNKSIDELYNQRVFDRLMLFNYYNHINSQKDKTSSTTSTTTVNPLEGRYPSTSHWSIRGWTGQFYPNSKISTTTPIPIITANPNIEYLDLFGSDTKISEMTTESPETTTTTTAKPEPPYKKIFNSQMGATFHSTKYSRPYSSAQKTRSDISNYLSSFTSTLKSI